MLPSWTWESVLPTGAERIVKIQMLIVSRLEHGSTVHLKLILLLSPHMQTFPKPFLTPESVDLKLPFHSHHLPHH